MWIHSSTRTNLIISVLATIQIMDLYFISVGLVCRTMHHSKMRLSNNEVQFTSLQFHICDKYLWLWHQYIWWSCWPKWLNKCPLQYNSTLPHTYCHNVRGWSNHFAIFRYVCLRSNASTIAATAAAAAAICLHQYFDMNILSSSHCENHKIMMISTNVRIKYKMGSLSNAERSIVIIWNISCISTCTKCPFTSFNFLFCVFYDNKHRNKVSAFVGRKMNEWQQRKGAGGEDSHK